ncbi:MAG TPA: hypothetical protein VLA48_05330 [Nitrososphaeraceae archaeon]|nr:hypothetical protein [Nitrososphaeraceae archaeon]
MIDCSIRVCIKFYIWSYGQFLSCTDLQEFPYILCGPYWYFFLNCTTFSSILLSVLWIVCDLLESSFSQSNPFFLLVPDPVPVEAHS